jgi:membrane protein DedA with SNARE-associated domain
MNVNDVVEYIHQYGDLFYLITFVWAALEGETFVIFAGFAVQRGYLNGEALVVAAWLGSAFGDQVCFWLGRCYGTRLLERSPKLKKPVETAIGWLENYAIAFILCYRFMYGVRNVSGIAIGMSHLPWQTFALWNAIAAFVWAVAFTLVGYFFGDAIAHLQKHDADIIGSSVLEISIFVLAMFAIYVTIRTLLIRWHKNQKK